MRIVEIYKDLVIGYLPYPNASLEYVRKQLEGIREHNTDDKVKYFIDVEPESESRK